MDPYTANEKKSNWKVKAVYDERIELLSLDRMFQVITDSDTTVQNYIESPSPLCMEELPINNGGGQGYGYIIYSATCTIQHQRGTLKLCGTVRNRAQVCSECCTLVEGYGCILYSTMIQHQRVTLKLWDSQEQGPGM